MGEKQEPEYWERRDDEDKVRRIARGAKAALQRVEEQAQQPEQNRLRKIGKAAVKPDDELPPTAA